jgi:hypothetical protein
VSIEEEKEKSCEEMKETRLRKRYQRMMEEEEGVQKGDEERRRSKR